MYQNKSSFKRFPRGAFGTCNSFLNCAPAAPPPLPPRIPADARATCQYPVFIAHIYKFVMCEEERQQIPERLIYVYYYNINDAIKKFNWVQCLHAWGGGV